MSRKKRSDSAAAAVDAAKAVALGIHEPPACCKLTDADRPFWESVMLSRARAEWSESDLIHAANLARCMRQVEEEQKKLDAEGSVIENGRGTPVMNPRSAVLRELSQRAMALTRLLQMHALASGDLRDKTKGREVERKAREAAREVQAEADLLA